MKKIISAVICFLTFNSVIFSQGTIENYKRAYNVKQDFSSNHVLYNNVVPNWIRGTHLLWYIRHTENGNEYVKVDVSTGIKSVLFNQEELANLLSEKTGKVVNKFYLPLNKIQVNVNADKVYFEAYAKRWEFYIKDSKLNCLGGVIPPVERPHWMMVDDEKSGAPVKSLDGKFSAFIKNDNVYVKNLHSGEEKQLSIDGTMGNYYSSYLQWSPDSKYVMSCKIRPAEKRFVYYVESSPKDQLQPKLHKQEYAKPGDELRFKIPCVFDVEKSKAIIPDTKLFNHQYNLLYFIWNADSKGITFEYNERGHKVYRVLEMSIDDGKVRTLIEEKEEKYVNYPRIYRKYLSDGKRIIWSSERDNYNHLYMYDRETGNVINQITKGKWYVREVQRVDEENEVIYFSASGMKRGEDPYLIHYYKINFDGSRLVSLTPEEGMHKCWYSSDYKFLVDVYSKIDMPPVAILRDAKNGKVCMELEKADISRLVAKGWKAPEVFKAKGRDEKTDIWGVIYRPANFDPNKKYPIVEYIYSGPGNQYVPKTFSSYNWNMTSLAELGFIVVQVDGMTTSFRTKEFEEVCYKNLKDAGLPDHIAWIKAAAKKYPYMDIDRVGIFGCSAGGQESTGAVLFHPEFYKAAYSACGCHDNRMDKIWWNELWMGYPVDESYRACSNVNNAHLLTRPLMLVVGEMDDNVDPASTMQLVNALIKAGKDFELVVIPSARHTMGESYGEHKRFDFFVKNLMGVNPPKWSELK